MRVQKPIQNVLLLAPESQPFRTACRATQAIFGPWGICWWLKKLINIIGRYEVVFPPRVSDRAKRWLPLSAPGRQVHADAILVVSDETINYCLGIRNHPPQGAALDKKVSLEQKSPALGLDRPGIVFNMGIAEVTYKHNGCVIVSSAENVVFKQRTVKTSRLQAAGAKTEAASI